MGGWVIRADRKVSWCGKARKGRGMRDVVVVVDVAL